MRESELAKIILWRRSGTDVRGGLVVVSSLSVRKAVLHERTGGSGGCRADAEDDAAISAVGDHGGVGSLHGNPDSDFTASGEEL